MRSNLSLRQAYLSAQFFFLFIDILLKLQQQILVCFCKLSYISVIIVRWLRILA